MSRLVYVNGRYVPHAHARVHIEDRGYQFADGVYEVVYVLGGCPVDRELHLDRLDRSLGELRIPSPLPRRALVAVLDEMIVRNRRSNGLLYMQVTRGVAPRAHVFPRAGTRPSLVVTLRAAPTMPTDFDDWVARAITLPDQRWGRCDIKSVGLLPNVLAKQAAREKGAYEAILIDSAGMVTEGATTTVWIVDCEGTLRTRALGHAILPGCTRAALMLELQAAGTGFEERAFSHDELAAAREVFLTSASSFIKPIVAVDDAPVADGRPGPIARRLFGLLEDRMKPKSKGLLF